jgi:PIN domain nuclease of toxin-antitoxin system
LTDAMSTVLVDTHAIIWFMARNRLERTALDAIALAQSASNALISPISVWDAALALRQRHRQPDLGGGEAAQWFRAVLRVPGFELAKVTRRIALEASQMPAILGRGDPGDCFLIATARVKCVPTVTRDDQILRLAQTSSARALKP